MICDRRNVLKRSMMGLGGMASLALLGGGLSAGAAGAPLETLVFLSKRLDASTAEFRAWYIEHHAPDFLSFARPYLKRYTQDFVERSQMGPVDFDCISQFEYRSLDSQAALLRVLETPEPKQTLATHPRPGSKPGPNEAHDGPRRFGIDERLLSGPPRGYDRPGTFKQAVLLRRKGSATPEAFALAVGGFGVAVARKIGAAAERMVLDVALPEEGRPSPLFDAVIQVWPGKGVDLANAFAGAPEPITIANIVDLLSYESDLSAR